ncbi:hypothetical protein LTR84_012103 [Exophiala bonariae]|uniref:Transcription factor domain-containing protein n=1 Tax=Exophiala bonariae TaxID=1690606 RepID=A0AAV9NJM8_9EURO|nr:hypothetical protein LTR84_012103 [Exophiala bonariae]
MRKVTTGAAETPVSAQESMMIPIEDESSVEASPRYRSESLAIHSQQRLEEEAQSLESQPITSQDIRKNQQIPRINRGVGHTAIGDCGDPSSQLPGHTNYPIPANKFVHRATHFYLKYYSPVATQRPHHYGVGQDSKLLKDYIPYILSDKMIFCAMVAMSSTAINIAATGDRARTPETLGFYQYAVSLLRQRLAAEGNQPSDAVIVTLSSLCGCDAMSTNYEVLDLHTRAIKRVVALRGGPDRLGFDGYLKMIVTGSQTFYNARHSNILDNEGLFPKIGKLTFPVHPFDPSLCKAISKLPPGISEMCLSGLLSHQIMSLVGRITRWSRNMIEAFKEADMYRLHRLSTNSANVTLCGEFLHREDVSLTEQLLVLALICFCYSLDATRAMFWITNAYLQIRCRHLNNSHIEVTASTESHMAWIGATLVATFELDSPAFLLGVSLTNARKKSIDWQANVRLCEQYFWNDALSLKLAAKIEYLTGRRAPIET